MILDEMVGQQWRRPGRRGTGSWTMRYKKAESWTGSWTVLPTGRCTCTYMDEKGRSPRHLHFITFSQLSSPHLPSRTSRPGSYSIIFARGPLGRTEKGKRVRESDAIWRCSRIYIVIVNTYSLRDIRSCYVVCMTGRVVVQFTSHTKEFSVFSACW